MMSQNSSVLSSMSLGNNNKYIYSDEQLMLLFQGGNENAYIELVNRYKDKLINFIFNYLGDIESSEDVVQETMIKLYQKKHYYKEIAKFSTWLYTIAKNLANTELRKQYIGEDWGMAKVRGTPNNTGDGLRMAFSLGAKKYGVYDGCHATPMDLNVPDFGGLDLPPIQRKLYRKICYFLGLMINIEGKRFVDEGENFRNYTYAQFGKKVIEQPKSQAWQIFDNKVIELLYDEYHFKKATFVEAPTLNSLMV